MSETSHNDLARDADLTARYRAAAQDAPPAALDDAIRAAARRAVGARPRPAGFSFGDSWRSSLSIAAVMVLSVSIVILMREEAPELSAPPRADSPPADTKLESRAGADESTAATSRGFVLDPQRSRNIGLKPPPQVSPPGLGMRQPEFVEQSPRLKKDANADRSDVDAAGRAELAKRREAAPDAAASRDNKVAASTARQSKAAEFDAQREIAQAPAASPPRKEAAKPAQLAEPAAGAVAGAPAENKTQVGQAPATADRVEPASRVRSQASSAPELAKQAAEAPPAPVAAAKPSTAQEKSAPQAAGDAGKLESFVDLPPEKWLERIVELRKQGRNENAKASLAAFRKRYPEYRLPDSLRDWAKQ